MQHSCNLINRPKSEKSKSSPRSLALVDMHPKVIRATCYRAHSDACTVHTHNRLNRHGYRFNVHWTNMKIIAFGHLFDEAHWNISNQCMLFPIYYSIGIILVTFCHMRIMQSIDFIILFSSGCSRFLAVLASSCIFRSKIRHFVGDMVYAWDICVCWGEIELFILIGA